MASPGAWLIADGLSWWRLLLIAVASVVGTCVSLIMAHRLWHVLGKQLGHAVDALGYLALAALVSSLATLGATLGAALENDRAVREAAYGYRPDARTEAESGEE